MGYYAFTRSFMTLLRDRTFRQGGAYQSVSRFALSAVSGLAILTGQLLTVVPQFSDIPGMQRSSGLKGNFGIISVNRSASSRTPQGQMGWPPPGHRPPRLRRVLKISPPAV
jgi:hypothetical protein